MAQTIAMQRGTSTTTTGSIFTMFTQSGGLATRVIPNMITFYGTDGQLGYPQVNIIYQSASGGNQVVGYFKSTANVFWSGQFMPANGAYGPVQTNPSAGNFYINSGLVSVNNGAGYTGDFAANYSSMSGTDSRFSYLPSNLWMGPSDSIKFSFYEAYGRTVQVAWSFTTITES